MCWPFTKVVCVCVCVFVVAKYVSWTTGKERAVSLVPAVAGSVAEFHQLHLSRYNIIHTHTHTLITPTVYTVGNFKKHDFENCTV